MSEDSIANHENGINFWLPIYSLVSYVQNRLTETKENILEITSSFPKQIFEPSTRSINWITCEEQLQNNFSNYYDRTDFVYLRHSLEKMENPRNVLNLLNRISKQGYIETTSPLVEALRGVHHSSAIYRGHALNKFIIWASQDNILYILPKYPILEHVKIKEELETKIRSILNTMPHYWNCYYEWSETNPLKYVYYQHGVNFNIEHDYSRLLEIAIEESVKSINYYLMKVNQSFPVQNEPSKN